MTEAPRIAVLDYGIGNLRSAEKALQHVGAAARLVTNPADVAAADAVVLPGVGAFGACARALRESGLEEPARTAIAEGVPFFGVCVGFQLLYQGSVESPAAEGLGVFDGKVLALPPGVKHPQMQWNQLELPHEGDAAPAALRGLGTRPWVYFVHSFAPPLGAETVAVCDYGGPVAALVCRGNLWGAQFHPEKSGATGLRLLSNFVDLAGRGLMDLLPAIDLRGGTAVRLTQGDFEREQRYGDPTALAIRYIEGGARWIHVVDLDAARTGVPHERAALGEIVELAARSSVHVQAGGGIRSDEAAEEVLESGVARVVLGTAALEEPALAGRCARRWPGRVAVGLDYRVGADGVAEAQAQGWLAGSGWSVIELLELWAGEPLGAVVVTEVERDGTLEGPDLGALGALLGRTELPLVASGGVGSTQDLSRLAQVQVHGRRLSGAIVGKALVEGRFSVQEGVAACAASD